MTRSPYELANFYWLWSSWLKWLNLVKTRQPVPLVPQNLASLCKKGEHGMQTLAQKALVCGKVWLSPANWKQRVDIHNQVSNFWWRSEKWCRWEAIKQKKVYLLPIWVELHLPISLVPVLNPQQVNWHTSLFISAAKPLMCTVTLFVPPAPCLLLV